MSQKTPPTLTTERLSLRPLTEADSVELHEMFNDVQTMRFMPTPPHQTEVATRHYIKEALSNKEAVHWAICFQESNTPIGIVNYLGGTAIPGLGYIIKRAYWGQGITAEACRAAITYGFETMGLNQVELWIDQHNVQSQRVAQKLGFMLNGQIPQKYAHEANHHIMYTYGLWRDTFLKRSFPHAAPRVFQVQPVLMVHHVQETAEYYRDKLGFNIDFLFGTPPNHAGVSYRQWTGQGVSLQLSQVSEEKTLSVSTYLYIFVDAKIDQLYERYKANAVEIRREPETMPWGMREFAINDLNGHILVFGTQT